jgi:multimeric flavodoxin WrbA
MILINGYYLVNGVKGSFIITNDLIEESQYKNQIQKYRDKEKCKRKEKNGKFFYDPDGMPCYTEVDIPTKQKAKPPHKVFIPTTRSLNELIAFAR